MPENFGPGAYINVHWAGPAKDDPSKKFWDGRACETIDDAVRTIAWANTLGQKDIYVCMSLQAKCEEKVSTKGNVYKRALRLAEDVVAIRSLFIDVDVKPGAYETTDAAMEALRAFVEATGMPIPSAVVMSGSGGFHVHWALDRDLTRAEWQEFSYRLAAATLATGLQTDSQCTIDSARILRVPGTLNHKHEVPREVTLFSLGDRVSTDQVVAALSKYDPVAAPAPANHFPENDDLGANMPVGPIDITLETAAKNCPFIGRTVDTGGKDNTQPLWFLTASIATFLREKRDALHLMSNQHPGYTPVETDRLYDRVEATKLKRDIGWPKCQKIALSGAPECASCPLLAQNKSPLNFSTNDHNIAADIDATLPKQYVRTKDGTIHVKTVDDDGTQLLIPISHYPILNGWLSNNPWTFHLVTKDEHDRRVVMEVPTEVITGKDGFSKYLGANGFFLTDKQYKIMKEFFVSWIQKLQTHKERVISSAPFGWSIVDSRIEGFAYGGRVWMPSGDRPAANPNPVLQAQYSPRGEDQYWREAARIVYSQKRPELDAILAVAFAAPLVRFTGFQGLILNAFSAESGIGKTTAMKVAQAMWAHPVLAMQGLNDTTNAVINKAGQIRCLPMMWDEIKGEQQTRKFCSIVFDVTGGKEKSRLNSDSTLKMSGLWNTLLVSASNDSIIDSMAAFAGSTTAGLYRVFEYVVKKPANPLQNVGVVQRLLGLLDDNFGHAGMVYAKFLGQNHKRVSEEVAAMQDHLIADLKADSDERLWMGTLAVLIKGADYANELGLLSIDTAALKNFLLSVLAHMRNEIKNSPVDMNNDMSVSSVLAEILSETRARNTLVTSRVWVGRGKPPKGSVAIKCDVSRLDNIVVQIGKEDKLIRISSTFLTRWMADRGYSRSTFVSKLEREFGLQKINGKLGGGTELSCAMEHILELDGNHPKLAALLDL